MTDRAVLQLRCLQITQSSNTVCRRAFPAGRLSFPLIQGIIINVIFKDSERNVSNEV